ncbi:hypothetical protein CfE428DRAFT_1855 [Chthoniobacter flavus Ellin428]|uniref:Uncharacterized protein n=1 Tax=Chthoniobacter flavus Ellin428 TaxID=497964 RepID=B4CYW7_9BACT|nr:hypothetical protein [Chthoniobacter flavus]EDY20658.1 hypothetical protein CfE428DRAFT_1855 [Chthoniobacter flavus Ellin428]
MPYTLEQLEFLGLHLGVVVPPEFLEKKRKGGTTPPPQPQPSSKTVTPEQTKIIEKRRTLLVAASKLTDPPFAATPALAALKLDREAATGALADEYPTPEQFGTAERAIAAFAQKVEEEKQRVIAQKTSLKKFVKDFVEPATAEDDEKNAIKAELKKVSDALKDETPTPAQIKTAETAIAAVKRMVKQAAITGVIAGQDPTQAREARTAFKEFAKVLGNEEPTPEAISIAGDEAKAAEKAVDDLSKERKALAKGPSGETEEAKKIRRAALKKKDEELRVAKETKKKAVERENALLGQKYLTEALEHGPLSLESGQRLKSGSSEMVKAFVKNPRLANSALKSLSTAQHPEVIAANIGKIADLVGDNFKASNGKKFINDKFAREYGENLLRMGGDAGPEFFDRLPDYVASGRQFERDPLGPSKGKPHVLAKHRGNIVAESMIKPDGSIDLNSDKAKNAIGDLLFNPQVLKSPTPSMTAHVLQTVKFLEDPVTGPEATKVLKATRKPTNSAAQKQIRRALGKGDTDEVDDNATRTAVLSAMLKPLNQGQVGSCFATAPCRRLRETEPLDAMKVYSEIASKGTYKPPFGERVPIVTNTPEDEDPLQRSFEYTLATSHARAGRQLREKAVGQKNLGRRGSVPQDRRRSPVEMEKQKGEVAERRQSRLHFRL